MKTFIPFSGASCVRIAAKWGLWKGKSFEVNGYLISILPFKVGSRCVKHPHNVSKLGLTYIKHSRSIASVETKQSKERQKLINCCCQSE